MYANQVTSTFGYDAQRFRPTSRTTTGPGGTYQQLTYGYDLAGNLTTLGDHRQIAGRTFGYDDPNRLTRATGDVSGRARAGRTRGTSTTRWGGSCRRAARPDGKSYTYDGSGNLQAGAGRALAWTVDNRLAAVSIQGGNAAEFACDAGGERVRKVMSAAVEHTPWGEVARVGGTAEPELGFTGQRLDPETGLMYYGGRYYDAVLGRFISPDPFVPAPGNPQALDRYAYVLNNPVNLIDPSGYFVGKLLKGLWKALPSIAAGIGVFVVVSMIPGMQPLAPILAGMAAGVVNAAITGESFAANIAMGAFFGGAGSALGPPLYAGLGGGFGGVVRAAAILGGTLWGFSAAITGGQRRGRDPGRDGDAQILDVREPIAD